MQAIVTNKPNRYRNPWHKGLNIPKPEYYENDAPCVGNYRGVVVYRLWDTSFDYVLEGCCITQRAGFSRERFTGVIDAILDGKEPVADEVAEHVRACGFSPMTYGEYLNKWSAGGVS